MNLISKALTTAGITAVTTVGLAQVALAETAPTGADDIYDGAASDLSGELLLVAGGVVVPAVTILAVKKGWPMVKRFF